MVISHLKTRLNNFDNIKIYTYAIVLHARTQTHCCTRQPANKVALGPYSFLFPACACAPWQQRFRKVDSVGPVCVVPHRCVRARACACASVCIGMWSHDSSPERPPLTSAASSALRHDYRETSMFAPAAARLLPQFYPVLTHPIPRAPAVRAPPTRWTGAAAARRCSRHRTRTYVWRKNRRRPPGQSIERRRRRLPLAIVSFLHRRRRVSCSPWVPRFTTAAPYVSYGTRAHRIFNGSDYKSRAHTRTHAALVSHGLLLLSVHRVHLHSVYACVVLRGALELKILHLQKRLSRPRVYNRPSRYRHVRLSWSPFVIIVFHSLLSILFTIIPVVRPNGVCVGSSVHGADHSWWYYRRRRGCDFITTVLLSSTAVSSSTDTGHTRPDCVDARRYELRKYWTFFFENSILDGSKFDWTTTGDDRGKCQCV